MRRLRVAVGKDVTSEVERSSSRGSSCKRARIIEAALAARGRSAHSSVLRSVSPSLRTEHLLLAVDDPEARSSARPQR